MKTVWDILILLIMGVCLTACSNDNEDLDLVNSKISAPLVKGKRLVKIKNSDYVISLEYNSQGQVSKIKEHYHNGSIQENSYWYEGTRVIWSPVEIIYNLRNGQAVECNYTAISETLTSFECHCTYSYDNNGYLVKTITVSNPEYEYLNRSYDYFWENGNINSVIESDSEGILNEYNIKYTSIENNIPLFCTYYYRDNVYLEWQGCFGKRCENLPQSMTVTNRTLGMENSYTDTYNYTFEDGFITKIVVESTTMNGSIDQEVYELEWW